MIILATSITIGNGAHLDEIMELGEHPYRLAQCREPRLLLIQRRQLEKLADALLFLDLESSLRFPGS